MWRKRLRTQYSRRAKDDQFGANTWLRETTDSMQGLLLPISATDEDIREKAEEFAWGCMRVAGGSATAVFEKWAPYSLAFCIRWGIRLDAGDKNDIGAPDVKGAEDIPHPEDGVFLAILLWAVEKELKTSAASEAPALVAMHAAAERYCIARGIEPPAVSLPVFSEPADAQLPLEPMRQSHLVEDFDVWFLALALPMLAASANYFDQISDDEWGATEELQDADPIISIEHLVALTGFDAVASALVDDARPALARMTDPIWWRRRLRAQHGRLIEQHAVRLGYIHAKGEKYVSDLACKRRLEQKRRNAETLKGVELINQHGEVFNLAELAERSNANPRIRKAELMTRVSGFEAIARELGHLALFLTLTAPSRYHSTGGENKNFDGSTAREAQQWLCKTWQLIRAWANRKEIRIYGFRVAEPHQDSCPHWHLLIFIEPKWRSRFMAKFRRYALRNAEAEALPKPLTVAEQAKLNRQSMCRGYSKLAREQVAEATHRYKVEVRRLENADTDRRKHGCSFVDVEMSEAASAAGYILKYISKNIEGYSVQRDAYGHDAVKGSARVDAWASTHGIRQFQQIGGAPVGTWRELRRLREAEALASERLDAARQAADDGVWEDYIRIQGGPTAKRKDLPLVIARTREGERWNGAEQCTEPAMPGRYGELPTSSVIGVLDRIKDRAAITRRMSWTTRRTAKTTELVEKFEEAWYLPKDKYQSHVDLVFGSAAVTDGDGLVMGRDFGHGGVCGFGVPWTRVNNCTPAPVVAAETGVSDAPDSEFIGAYSTENDDEWADFDRGTRSISGFVVSGRHQQ